MLFNNTIRARLQLFALLAACLPVLFALGTFVLVVQGEVEENRLQEMRDNLRFKQRFVEDWLEEELTDVVFLSSLPAFNPPLRDGDLPPLLRDFVEQNPGVSSALAVDDRGVIVAASDDSLLGISVEDRDYFRKARSGPTISKVILGRATGDPMIIFAAPLRDGEGRFAGIASASVRLESITQLLTELRIGRSGDSYIFDGQGRALGRPKGFFQFPRLDEDLEIPIISQGTLRALSGAGKGMRYRSRTGRAIHVVSRPAKEGEWLLVSEMSRKEIMAAFWNTLALLGLGLGLTLLVLLPVLFSLTSSIVAPIQNLADTARILIDKGYQAVDPMPPGRSAPKEVRTLDQAFQAMLGKIRRTIADLERTTVTDPLTGLPNRRFLQIEASRLVKLHERSGEPMACLMIDLDHFKRINDTHGHTAGDEVLRRMGDLLAAILRGSDMVVRYGGEEFAVLAPNTSMDEACQLAERIRAGVAELEVSFGGQTIPLSASIGVSELNFSKARRSLEEVLDLADKALYRAKGEGRNRAVCRMDEPAPPDP
ncbi:sensor domain-containing diguanylate cyclase [Desulfohalovibrio reitneri]|uniref:sensor domain-containing diguanylate cyclase n=1 Tax=Desulfohalovibrio reitneri TaxID=1307759 RepID=UPI0004A72882|nr:sensor domain-containing diguanylate cyclase [Desulfohalovibrio reitneri]